MKAFEESFSELIAARERLNLLRDAAAKIGKNAEWEHQEYRVGMAIVQIHSLRELLHDNAPLLKNLRRLLSDADDVALNSAIFVIRGGIATITATTYSVNRFCDIIEGKTKQINARHALGGLMQWAAGGLLYGGLKK